MKLSNSNQLVSITIAKINEAISQLWVLSTGIWDNSKYWDNNAFYKNTP